MCRKLCYLISFVLFLGLAVTSTADAADPNLVGYWQMDESWGNVAGDVAGHDYDGELHWGRRLLGETDADGITWQPAGGMVNGAVQFGDSNSTYIAAQDMDEADEPIDPNWPDGTLAMWLKLKDPQPTNRRDGNMRFAHGTGSGGRKRVWFDATGDPFIRQISFGLGDNLRWQQYIWTLQLDTWYYLAVTWDNLPDSNDGTGRVFLDGNDLKISAPYTGMTAFMSNVLIGNSSTSQGTGDGSQSFCGLLDDVAIWNIAKTEPEIVAIYNTGVTKPTFARATEPNPGRGDYDVGIGPNAWPDPNLNWVAGVGATSHDVYFGTNEANVTDGTGGTFKGNQPGTDFDPGVLALGQTYYWRIDEILVGPTIVTGRVWSFTVDEGKATMPDPEDDDEPSGADETAPGAILSWRPGAFADTHEIYLGTNEQDVNIADDSNDVYMGTDAAPCVGDASRVCYDPCGLTLGETYYWRIDEVNSVYGTVRGDVWGFKVYAYLTVDDWEVYTSPSNMLGTWNKAKNAHALVLEQTVEDGADDSNQFMEMMFVLTTMSGYTPPYYAEAWRDIPITGRDFTGGGFAKALAVSYMASTGGGTTSDFGEMYVRLEDGSGGDTDTVTLTDPNLDAYWHEWNIDLAAFDNPDLDLTDIRKIHLGVGDGTDRGYGYVYFDEIRKYALRCMTDYVDLDGDINGDCIVNFEDIEDMGSDWLISDSNSIGFDGLLDPDAFLPPGGWVSDPCRGNCLAFDGHEDTPDDSNDWVDIDDYLLPEFQNRTIASWVKNDDYDQEESYRVHIFSSTSYDIGLNIGATGTREGNLEGRLEDCKMTRIPDSHLDVNEWHHVALVMGNKSIDNYVYCELYLDGAWIADNENPGTGGSAVASDTIARHTGTRLPNANIGSYEDGGSRFIQATLDDFRIYDHNLPAQDVNELYEGTDGAVPGDANLILWYKFDETSGYIAEDSGRDKDTHIYHPMNSSANIVEKVPPGPPYDPDNKDIVNFVDYAALADDWLVEKMWPPQP